MKTFYRTTVKWMAITMVLTISALLVQPVYALTEAETNTIVAALQGDGTQTTVADTVKNMVTAAIDNKFAGLTGAALEDAIAAEMADIFNAVVASNSNSPTPMSMEQLSTLFTAGASVAVQQNTQGVSLDNIVSNFGQRVSTNLEAADLVQFQAGVSAGQSVGIRIAQKADEYGIDPTLLDQIGVNEEGALVVSVAFLNPDGEVEAYGTDAAGNAIPVISAVTGGPGENANEETKVLLGLYGTAEP